MNTAFFSKLVDTYRKFQDFSQSNVKQLRAAIQNLTDNTNWKVTVQLQGSKTFANSHLKCICIEIFDNFFIG